MRPDNVDGGDVLRQGLYKFRRSLVKRDALACWLRGPPVQKTSLYKTIAHVDNTH